MWSLGCTRCGGDLDTGHTYDCLEIQVREGDRLLDRAKEMIDSLRADIASVQRQLEAEERWKIKNGRELPDQILFPLYRTPQELSPHIGVGVGGLFDTHATARYILEGTNLEIDGKPIGACV